MQAGMVVRQKGGALVITYQHDKHGVHHLMWRHGSGVVAYGKELIHNTVFADYGHDGKLIGITVIMEDEERTDVADRGS